MKTIARGLTPVCFILLAFFFAGAARAAERWELLGQRTVAFGGDHDRIDVGRSEGRFRQIEIRVRNAPIELSNMVVTFGNNETFRPKLRHKFTEGSGSRVIDLPGERRSIRRIDFNYKSLSRREGKGVVEVYAR